MSFLKFHFFHFSYLDQNLQLKKQLNQIIDFTLAIENATTWKKSRKATNVFQGGHGEEDFRDS